MDWKTVGLIDKKYNAQPWEHVLVNFNTAAPGDIPITLPPLVGQHGEECRVRVTDVSADGGVGNGAALRIVGPFAQIPGGHYAASGYVVAKLEAGGVEMSRRGASIELHGSLAFGGWLVVAEGYQPVPPSGLPAWLQWLGNLFKSSKR
jgi:hypothetical protein